MSLPAPREEKESAHQTVEELIKLQLSISREDMENGIQPISPIMSYCIFNVERMAPPSLGLPVYSGLDPASLLLQSVVEHTILNKQFFGLLDGILRDPSRSCAINECVDKTILDLTKQNFSKYQLAQRIAFLANKRSQDALQRARNLQQKLYNTNFSIKLCCFSSTSSSYLDIMVLKYTFGVNFYELMHDLQVWTSHRVIPPPLPLVLDPEYKIPINLQNRTSLMDGRSDFKKGYTAEDGEWVWTMSELQTVNGKRAWGRIGQGKLVVCEDMVKLFEAMKHGLDGRSFDSCRTLVVIHLQDQIAMHRWQHFDQYAKNKASMVNMNWSEEDAEKIDEFLQMASAPQRTANQGDVMCLE